jgi:hypothetical protein
MPRFGWMVILAGFVHERSLFIRLVCVSLCAQEGCISRLEGYRYPLFHRMHFPGDHKTPVIDLY